MSRQNSDQILDPVVFQNEFYSIMYLKALRSVRWHFQNFALSILGYTKEQTGPYVHFAYF